jgi:CheY-like chemotaxis protein
MNLPSASSKRILCVDDESAIRTMLALHLARYGYHAETAEDGLEALARVEQDPGAFDLIVTDNQMPHLDGLTLVERVRGLGYSGAIVFFSSTLQHQESALLGKLKVSAVVQKGRPMADVIGAIQHALGDA